jgi:hypothetical protein
MAIGLNRIEALIEKLDRSLDLSSTTITGLKLATLFGNGTSAKTANFTAAAGYIYLITKLDGCDVVLPAPTIGARIRLVFGAVTSNEHTITSDAATTLYTGYALMQDTLDGTAAQHVVFAPDGSNDRILTMNGTTTGVSGVIDLLGTSTTEWLIEGTIASSGTVATPFS